MEKGEREDERFFFFWILLEGIKKLLYRLTK